MRIETAKSASDAEGVATLVGLDPMILEAGSKLGKYRSFKHTDVITRLSGLANRFIE